MNDRIQLSPLEFDLLRSESFVRLGRLRQLGMASFVFPSATHSRAVHSLGVMFAIGQAADALDRDSDERRLLRLGGLLHDIGQYPLSHCIELVYRSVPPAGERPYEQIVKSGGKRNKPEKELTALQRVTVKSPSVEEATDKALGQQIVLERPDVRAAFEKHGAASLIEDVASLVGGVSTHQLYTQLLNSDYDCDRLDYVRRDSYNTGVAYGDFSLQFLLENMVVRPAEPNSTDLRMLFRSGGGPAALEQYLIARYNMYSQVYFNKTVRSLELSARALFLRLAEAEKVFPDHRAIRSAIPTDGFLSFDDSYFWAAAHEAMGDGDAPQDIRELAERVVRRVPLPLAYEYRTLSYPKDDSRYMLLQQLGRYGAELEALCDQTEIDISRIVVDILPSVKFLPGSEPLSPDRVQALLNEAASGDELSDVRQQLNTAPRVLDEQTGRISLLTARPSSVLGQFVGKELFMVRVHLEHASEDERARLGQALDAYSQGE